MSSIRPISALLAVLALTLPCCVGSPMLVGGGQLAAAEGTDKWEDSIKAFEAADAKSFPAPGGNVFIGSSSIVKWTSIVQDLAPAPIIKRGFGGSQISDSLRYTDRIIIPYKPKRVFVYAGDNDLAAKRTPEDVAKDFEGIAAKVHAALPATKIFWITIKPSPSRAKLMPEMVKANGLVKEYAAAHPEVTVVDVYTPMLGTDGQPRGELFEPDHLHMVPEGYKLWTSIIKPLLAD